MMRASELLTLALAACSVQREVEDGARVPTIAADSFGQSGLPDTNAGHQFAWMLHVLDRNDGLMQAAEIPSHFHPAWLVDMSVVDTLLSFYRMAEARGPVIIREITRSSNNKLEAIAESDDRAYQVTLHVDSMTGLIVTMRWDPIIEADSIAAIEEIVPSLAPRAQLLVAALDREGCRPLYEVNAAESLAIASIFKLWVLLALDEYISSGEATWDTPMMIRDEWKTGPVGTGSEPAGTTYPLSTFARRMIHDSDNTATDHLLYTVGRGRVDAAMRAVRDHDTRNAPIMSTREFFLLRSMDVDTVTRYLTLSEQSRRELLDRVFTGTPPRGGGGPKPRFVDEIGWFASARTVCSTMAELVRRTIEQPSSAAMLDILAYPPSTRRGAVSLRSWSYLGRKGGDLPGIRSMVSLLRRDDGAWYVIVLGFNDPENKMDERFVSRPMELAISRRIADLLLDEGL